MKTPPIAAILSGLILLGTVVLAQDEEGVRSRIKRVPVQSSNVASVGYSRHLRALEIEFVRGAVYRFTEVPPRLYHELLEASSKGHFINEKIRGQYKFVRVRPRRPEEKTTNAASARKK